MADAHIRAVITAQDRASATLNRFGKSVEGIGEAAERWLKRGAVAAGAATGAFLLLGIKTAASLESARMGFVTLLGSAEAADKVMQRIKDEARRTPFQIAGLTQATQLLTAVTKDGDRALDFILDIGEGLAAMGRGQEELDRIAVNIQQIAATGRAFGIDIRQFAFAGIPIYEMLQQEIGLTGEALQQFIEQGGVTFDLLEKMFRSSTEEGGRFFGAFKNQLGTFNQQWSNLKDTFAITAAEIVVQTGLFDALKNGMQRLSTWVTENKEQITSFLKTLGDMISFLMKVFNAFRSAVQFSIDVLAQLILWGWAVVDAVQRVAAIVSRAFQIMWNATTAFVSPIINVFQTLIQWISNAIHWLGSLARAVANSPIGKIAGLIGAVGGFIGDLFRQHGGPVTAGQPYIVGERGPEMIIPRQSGTVIPNNQMGFGGTINLNVNIGMFAGTPMERRKIAETLFMDLTDIANSKGINLQTMIARS